MLRMNVQSVLVPVHQAGLKQHVQGFVFYRSKTFHEKLVQTLQQHP